MPTKRLRSEAKTTLIEEHRNRALGAWNLDQDRPARAHCRGESVIKVHPGVVFCDPVTIESDL